MGRVFHLCFEIRSSQPLHSYAASASRFMQAISVILHYCFIMMIVIVNILGCIILLPMWLLTGFFMNNLDQCYHANIMVISDLPPAVSFNFIINKQFSFSGSASMSAIKMLDRNCVLTLFFVN